MKGYIYVVPYHLVKLMKYLLPHDLTRFKIRGLCVGGCCLPDCGGV